MRRTAALGAVLLAAGGCELTEVALVEPADVVVVEAYVRLGATPFTRAEMTAFLHRTLQEGRFTPDPPPARVAVTRPSDGRRWELLQAGLTECVISHPVIVTGVCYRAPAGAAEGPMAGDRLELEVILADGRRLASEAAVPGDFQVVGVEGGLCALPARAAMDVRWTRSRGAWAYLVEALVSGLPPHFDVEVDDPLHLLGLAVSDADTSLVFPREAGVLARAELARPVALYLQEGLPPGASAAVTVTAADRNWVNWARGGNFNPSGQVRVPSVRGEGGTGVFGAGVVRRFGVVASSADEPSSYAPCPRPSTSSTPFQP